MEKRPPISFVIPAYNCRAFLPQAVASIADGNLQDGDEIVIVNDGSTDGTAAVIDALAASAPCIRVCAHRYNKGSAAAARNTAIDAATHDLLFTLDADNLLLKDSIAPLARMAIAEGIDAAAFQEVCFFSHRQDAPTHSWMNALETTLADALAGHYWPGPTGNYLFTRQSWLRAGRYDESVGGGIDSWAFGIRQLATGSRMKALPASRYMHRWGHDSAWKRDAKAGKQSRKALQALLPFIDLLEQESVDYLLAPEGRDQWFENLAKRPLRVRNAGEGSSGYVARHRQPKEPFIRRLRRFAAQKIAPGD